MEISKAKLPNRWLVFITKEVTQPIWPHIINVTDRQTDGQTYIWTDNIWWQCHPMHLWHLHCKAKMSPCSQKLSQKTAWVFFNHPPAILFYCCCLDLFLFLRRLISEIACHKVNQIYKIASKIWVAPSPEFWRPKNIKILARFHTTSQLDWEYLWNATRHCQSENGVANYRHSRTGKLNPVYFGVNGVKQDRSSDPPNGRPSGRALPRI